MLLPSRVAGRTLDLCGPDLARGPEVARRWYIASFTFSFGIAVFTNTGSYGQVGVFLESVFLLPKQFPRRKTSRDQDF